MTAHQSLDPAAAYSSAPSLQFDMNTGAAIAPAVVAMNLLDVLQEFTILSGSRALGARTPGVIAGPRDIEHVAHDPHRVVDTAIFDEAKSQIRGPAKIAIGFFKM